MNTHLPIVGMCLLLSASAGAIEARTADPRTGERNSIVIDCADPARPSQREVGEMTGQHNFGQVYATRARLMAEVRRACQREGTVRVRLVMAPTAHDRTIAQAGALP